MQLFLGTAKKDAQKDGADLIDPSGTETIEYTDGSEPKEVYTFDVPVKKLDEEFDLALIGTKGKWYDHKVSVSNPVASNRITQNIKLRQRTHMCFLSELLCFLG